ncbi:hypothetical protein N0V90_003746 [Kalmusia sp. IMI 367209]|nr:hypothetical protein N0V90_003746 [Kalmusia sp. IMI 367209]
MSQAATPGPARRSARLSSVARSVASQSVVSVSIPAKDTPARKRGALPKLKSRQSTAYGASGRIGAAQELSVPQTGFSEAFDTQRGAAIARNSEERSVSGRNGRAAGRTPTSDREVDTPSQVEYESEDPPSEEEEEEDEEEEDEEDESANTSKSFGMGHEAGMLRQPTPRRQAPLASTRPRAVTPRAVANGPRRPLENPIDRDHQESERRVPPVQPVAGGDASRFPLIRSAQEPRTGGLTPRVPSVRSAQVPAAGGTTPRITAIRSGLESAAGSAVPRIPPARPIQVANGGATAPRRSPPRVVPEPRVEPEGGPQVRLGSENKGWPWYYYLLAALTALSALALALLASHPSPSTITDGLSDSWKNFANRFTPSISSSARSPVDHSGIKARVDDLELTLKDVQRFLHSLGDEVPEYVVVSRSPSGTMNVAKGFWDAVISRIRKEGPSIEWDTFVERNQEQLDRALGKESTIIREDLLKTLESNFNDISADFDKKLASHTKVLLESANKAATKEARKVAVEHARLRSLALSNLISNVELHFNKINYAAPGLGAGIITGITSPTYTPKIGMAKRVLQRFLSRKHYSPAIALQKWDEPGECWCAAPDEAETGKAQLGIQLAEPILPTQLTIEHLPRSSAPGNDIKSAPQNVELWIESNDPAVERFEMDGEQCEPGPAGWQCLGKVRYDINGANHVQTFLLDGAAQTPVDKVMLRVTSNHGADHTCIYRVRLYGNGLSPVSESGASQ